MTSREIVRRTLEYCAPERVARSFGDSDFLWAGCNVKTRASDWKEIGNGRWERTDEWGNLWARLDPTSKGEVVKGVLDDLADMDSYKFPEYSCAAVYAPVSERRAAEPEKWLNGGERD